ncbi:MAG: RagB/SusD family nutrient uptake outer membrane protein, partial [Bacteroidales bacterium]
GEEMRRFTLVRTDKLVERTKKYNEKSAGVIKERHKLWPIPQNIIDANSGVKWENNPGYN